MLAFFFVFAITNKTHQKGDAMYSEDVEARRDNAQQALKVFFTLAHHWRLSRPEAMTLLGLNATSTYANWKNGKTGPIPRDTLERISYLCNINDKLQHRWPQEDDLIHWLRSEQTRLGGHSPLGRMLEGRVIDIYWLQENLDLLLSDARPVLAHPVKTLSSQSPIRTIHSL